MHVEAAPFAEIDSQTAGELAGVQRSAASHEQVDLQLRSRWMRFVLERVRMARRSASAST
jgi:hypothetical protein